jgi:hypothetical protein
MNPIRRPFSRRSFFRFAILAMAAAFASLLAVALLNVCVDPLEKWQSSCGKALAPYKKLGDDPTQKASQCAAGPWQVVLVGASRTELGLDPAAPALKGRPAYNFGLSGVGLPGILRAAHYALAHDDALSALILELDPTYLRAESPDRLAQLDASPLNPELDRVDFGFKMLFGSQATAQSFKVLRLAAKRQPVDGGRGLRHYNEHDHPPYELFAAKQWGVPGFDAGPFQADGGAGGFNVAQMDDLLPLAQACRARGVRLVVFVPPSHAVRLAAFAKAGHWPRVKAFKRRLATLAQTGGFEAHDCMGCGPWATEDIPSAAGSRMRWYHEAIHFRKELGDRMLEGALGATAVAPGGLGAVLAPESVEAHLKTVDRDLCGYITAHPGLSGLLPTEGLADQVAASSP